jgi:hypothetical protein
VYRYKNELLSESVGCLVFDGSSSREERMSAYGMLSLVLVANTSVSSSGQERINSLDSDTFCFAADSGQVQSPNIS